MNVSRETWPLRVSRETLPRLHAFVELLRAWNSKINLVSAGDLNVIWERHIQDSLQLLPLLPDNIESAVDLGSGAGFPGLIVAIASGIRFTLIESDFRKAAFLREATRVTGAAAEIVTKRVEQVSVPKTALITARGLAPLSKLLNLSAPLLAPGGTMLFPKGPSYASEVVAARRAWSMRLEQHVSQTQPGSVILRISDAQRV